MCSTTFNDLNKEYLTNHTHTHRDTSTHTHTNQKMNYKLTEFTVHIGVIFRQLQHGETKTSWME